MSDLIQRGIVLLPPQNVRDWACTLSNKIQPWPMHFVLKPGGAIPHISLHQLALPAHNQPYLRDRLMRVARYTKPFHVQLRAPIGIFWDTLFFWDAEIDASIREVHQRLIDSLNPLREGKLLPIHEQLLADPGAPDDLKESLRATGNPLAGKTFRPHITLSRAKNVNDVSMVLVFLKQLTPALSFSFPVRTLYLAEVGPHGTCPKLLEQFHFKE